MYSWFIEIIQITKKDLLLQNVLNIIACYLIQYHENMQFYLGSVLIYSILFGAKVIFFFVIGVEFTNELKTYLPKMIRCHDAIGRGNQLLKKELNDLWDNNSKDL